MKYKPILYGSVHATSCEPETLPVINSGKIITVLLRGPNYVCLWNHLFRYSFFGANPSHTYYIYIYICITLKKILGCFHVISREVVFFTAFISHKNLREQKLPKDPVTGQGNDDWGVRVGEAEADWFPW